MMPLPDMSKAIAAMLFLAWIGLISMVGVVIVVAIWLFRHVSIHWAA